ncbi:MAG: OadG family protein [Nitrospinae bacterium]|nr:OadG family protein [Nitrospinota bacterium]
MENLGASLVVTVIGMGVIFLVLGLLEACIYILVWAFPYVAPAAPKPKPVPASAGEQDTEVVAAIQTALTQYLKKDPGKITVRKG